MTSQTDYQLVETMSFDDFCKFGNEGTMLHQYPCEAIVWDDLQAWHWDYGQYAAYAAKHERKFRAHTCIVLADAEFSAPEPTIPESWVGETEAEHERNSERPEEFCGCEHANHFPDYSSDTFVRDLSKTYHTAWSVPAGNHRAAFVGAICDACAADCMKDHLV